jgi:hypothetical protein
MSPANFLTLGYSSEQLYPESDRKIALVCELRQYPLYHPTVKIPSAFGEGLQLHRWAENLRSQSRVSRKIVQQFHRLSPEAVAHSEDPAQLPLCRQKERYSVYAGRRIETSYGELWFSTFNVIENHLASQ